MPKYEVDVGGKTYEVDAPDSNTAWQWANYTHTQAAPPEAKPAPFSLSDTALSAAQSALGATKSTIEGITGAGSAPGEYLEGISKKLGAQMTPERQAEQQRRSQLEKQAAETGKPLEEIAAGLGGIKEAPIQTFAQGVGSMAPTVLLSMGAGALGAAVGAPVLVAAGVGIGVKYLIGALQGAGEVKSSIYDAVKEKLESTLPPEEAKRQAIAAQDYLGKNWDTIAQGLGLGAAASGTGAEAEVLKRFSKPIAKQIAAKEGAKAAEAGFLKAAGKEALGEGAQGGQQQYAENVALTREGYTTNALKGVYGATARDAAMGAIVGGAVHPLTGRAPEEAKPVVTPTPAEPGPQLPPEAPVGTQGTLFTKEDLAGVDKRKGATIEPTPVPPQTPRPPTPPAAQGEQLGLGLDFERDYADLVKERERLKQAPQTPEVKARIAELTDQVESLHEMEIGKIRAEKTLDTEAKDRFPGLTAEPTQAGLFPEIDVVRPTPEAPPAPRTAATANDAQAIQRAQDQQAQEAADAAQKEQERKGGQYRLPLRTVPESRDVGRGLTIPARPDELTMQDLEDIGFPMRSAKTWLEQNVVGKTPAEIQVLVANNPDLLLEKGTRAQILKYLTAPVPEGYKEAPRVTPITPPNKPQQQPQPRGGKPSVGVPSQPAGVQPVQPGAGVSPAARAPTAPVGLGLAPAGQPVSTGVVPKSAPAPTLKSNAPETPTVAAKPAPAPTPAKVVETPAAPKAAETVEEETARKAEAEDVKRRLEEVERKLQARPTPRAETPAPKVEKPEPKEIPDKLREPVGTSEFGMEEGEKEILRGPQGMLFPMSKREEIEYAERKDATPKEAAEEPAAKDERQTELDLRERVPENVQKVAEELKGTVAYHGADGSIIRSYDSRTGESIYIPLSADKADYFTQGMFGGALDIGSIRGDVTKIFTQKDFDALKAEVTKLKQQDAADAAKYPDGPFTRATTNVVAGDSIDPRYTNYLTELMQSLGLGDVRVFLYHGKDVKGRGDELHLHGDYYPILSRAEPDKGQNGATKPIGPTGKDFMLFVNDNMSEARTLEVIAHELGHMIQAISYDKAPANVKTAIKNEYNDWVDSLKGKKLADLVASLRNRYTVEEMESKGITDVEIKKMGLGDLNYWMGFDEWFADNVSRWATTADKPLTITEKFFSKVAQMMRDLVALVTGRKFPPNKKVAEFIDAMGPGSADMWMATANPTGATKVQPLQNAVSYTTQQLVDSMGPLDATQKNGLQKLITGVQANPDIDYVTKFRTQTADIAATIEQRLRTKFDGAVRDSLGKLNPMGLYRQAQDYAKMLLEYYQTGTLYKDPTTGLWMSGVGKGVRPPAEVYALIDKYAAKNGYSRDRATQIASRVLEGVRLDAMRTSNRVDGTTFTLHLKDAEINQLLAEYNADPDLRAMSKLMDEARIAMVDNMVKVGRLTKEMGDDWKKVVGYVPFDRIEDFSNNFHKVKKISGKGLAQVGKLPELVGSLNRPVGNVFDNYTNTLGWMVGQTLKTDATVTTLRALEDIGFAKFLGRSTQQKDNTVGMYVNGEMQYWELPSKYDVMAFKDLNAPKPGWLRNMGAFSNVLRKAVTVLPPFALKQVTDDVQRAILTSGVKNPGALIWMSLTNFPKLALAELRGIQHPMVKDFGVMGLTGEYDFQEGKPAISLLKDLGYKKRGRFETILHRLDGITRASDLAVRKAIYDQTLNEGGDQLLAQTRAREFINFRRRGANEFVGVMVTTIPFFNAYVQGMDVLYRAASGKDSSSSVDRAQARRLFWSRAAITFMLSSLYALGKDDEDKDYQDMDLLTRDNNWVFPGGYKLSVPGELGAIFKVIPERVVEYMRRQGTPEEQEAFEAVRTTLSYMYQQYIGRVTPIPQAIKPVIEAWANKSFLTGRALEGFHHKAMDPTERVTEQTSEIAKLAAVSDLGKAISEFSKATIGVEVSPIMVDNALRGYFGSSAAMLTMVTDSLLNPTRVDRPLHKYALLSNYLYDSVGTRRMTEFYDEREKVGKANNTLRELMKTDLDRAEKYVESHSDELQLESAVNSTLEHLQRTRAYRKFLNSVEGAKDMSKEDREAELKEVKQMEVEYVQWVREAKAELRKVQ
jgi:hypothetical protein